MLTAFFAHWTAFFMKITMALSHMKLMAAAATGNVKILAHHVVYKQVMHVARPALMWHPI
jgi:hypothetical protein